MRPERVHGLSDEALMDRYARGDGAAFDELFARYQERAYAFFLWRVGSAEHAADLYQELFLRIHRARERYDPGRPFAPWFFQIARRLLIDALRHRGRSREDLALDAGCAESGEPGPERRVAATEQAAAILARLSAVERYVLVSAKLHGRNYTELAAELGKSTVAVKKLASRAVQRLRAGDRVVGEPAVP